MTTCPGCSYGNVPGTLFCEQCGLGLTTDALGRRFPTGDISTASAVIEEAASVPSFARGATADIPPSRTRDVDAGRSSAVATDARSRPGLAEAAADSRPTAVTAARGGASGELKRETSTAYPTTRVPVAAERAGSGSLAAEPAGQNAGASVYLVADSGRRVDVPLQSVVIVGREDMRSGIRPDVDLTLDGASAAGVSRRHCRLLRQDDGWYIEDLMSTNFTVLNGRALSAHTPSHVRDGDELRLGKLRLSFHEA